ncbi:MAG TPA: inosine/xanthosine triphosphatase [Pseudonocardia sp.]|jgi:inosine/xanthosine triphosphatase|uniref:inosine/xanthosine triphosphatase n=1 Tax=Pseudonocardia sp. TaxID=60912 RepID=UPI002B4B47C3|nr:inosine/xanthosine triphosphatase [Pseudonocardia sp.]HLU54399.1 inosine/xanthosine triphosphatase [Pseudonocardia sp.]
MLVAVGSKNPVKIESVRLAYAALRPDEQRSVEGCEVDSSVPDQPLSEDETRLGARMRARRAREALGADHGVGLEGGLQELDGRWFNCGWVCVVDADGREGLGATIRMVVPQPVMDLVLAGHELGEACRRVLAAPDGAPGNGHFGLMTGNAVDRTRAYRDAVVAALAGLRHAAPR